MSDKSIFSSCFFFSFFQFLPCTSTICSYNLCIIVPTNVTYECVLSCFLSSSSVVPISESRRRVQNYYIISPQTSDSWALEHFNFAHMGTADIKCPYQHIRVVCKIKVLKRSMHHYLCPLYRFQPFSFASKSNVGSYCLWPFGISKWSSENSDTHPVISPRLPSLIMMTLLHLLRWNIITYCCRMWFLCSTCRVVKTLLYTQMLHTKNCCCNEIKSNLHWGQSKARPNLVSIEFSLACDVQAWPGPKAMAKAWLLRAQAHKKLGQSRRPWKA